ncbi:CBS domain-containing protein [Pseudothauera nasutitermitis]|uniref:histidine kinase n=1 Tax=Pseudothauera nasutitermitis TaxID=2565930 RepID=A0A4S4AV12_9RHOO|nr:ATP-binding protein [Pseudothauera nasutitermitis]THF63831.1 CBS domain-containing protein [Pseudothauera nasutitermitis]
MADVGELERLLKPVQALTPEVNVDEVARRFLLDEHRAFLSLPVADAAGQPLGLISRYRLQDIFMRRFGRELWGTQPVSEVMNPAPLVLRIDTPFEEAATQVTTRLSYPVTEDFILVDEAGRYRGIGTVPQLLKAMEDRLVQRNRALHRTLEDLKRSQAQLVQSEKMASLGQMVAGIAHELNTPLGYVGNNVELIRALSEPLFALNDALARLAACLTDPAGDEEAVARAFEAAEQARREADADTLADDLRQLLDDTGYGLEQISELVKGLKDFSRLDRAPSDDVDLNDCVRAALLIARNNLKNRVEVRQQLQALPPLRCAPSQINQVLLNLLNNAAQAMDGDGVILIKTWAEDARVLLSVEDNGKGMPPEVLERIFDPFFTTKPVGEGTGLGLSICYRIIRDHGGSIRVASRPGRGTRFLIALPLQRAAHTAEADSPVDAPSPREAEHV